MSKLPIIWMEAQFPSYWIKWSERSDLEATLMKGGKWTISFAAHTFVLQTIALGDVRQFILFFVVIHLRFLLPQNNQV